LSNPAATYLALWHRTAGPGEITLPVAPSIVDNLFPTAPDGWTYTWTDNGLRVTTEVPEPSARIIRLTPS